MHKGFKYVSFLPGGFQQVHDLAKAYGFKMSEQHDDSHGSAAAGAIDGDFYNIGKSNSDVVIDSDMPVIAPMHNCYHCLVSLSKVKTHESQTSLVNKRYGSILNNFNQTNLRVDNQESFQDLSQEVTPTLSNKNGVDIGPLGRSDSEQKMQTLRDTTDYQG